MCDLDILWPLVADLFPILNGNITSSNASTVSSERCKEIGRQLANMDALKCFNEIIMLEICSHVRKVVAPQFWKKFNNPTSVNYTANGQSFDFKQLSAPHLLEQHHKFFNCFAEAVIELHGNYAKLLEYRQRLELINVNNIKSTEQLQSIPKPEMMQETIRVGLLAQLPSDFNTVVISFYWLSFRIFCNVQRVSDAEAMNIGDVNCIGCNAEVERCRCYSLLKLINDVNSKLSEMNLLDRIAGNAMTSLVEAEVVKHISDSCQGVFDRSHLKELESWLQNVIIKWLSSVYCNKTGEAMEVNGDSNGLIQGFKVKLTYLLYEKFARSVIDQFFSIIIDFPDSGPAIEDLKICMEKIDMRKYLTKTLKETLESRILHPGVNTMDILTGYIAAIKAIRHLDSSGFILETVTAPIKEYLRKRSDTVRRVVTGLTEEGPTDLSEELARGETVKENKSDGLSNWENWLPDPLGFDQNSLAVAQSSKIMRSADIISMIVDIYGSKELFMTEYRNLMGGRLLTQLDFNSEKEIRNLELLKLRFGESLLHSCEVMLKDITDSKRINAHIQADDGYKESKMFDISALIISAQFWPSFNKESLEIPEEIENEFKKYTKSYEAYKGNRTLNWRTVTGRVTLDIEFGERVIEMTVAPTQAVIIYYFQKKNEWTLDELSNLTKVPPSVLRRRISFWQNNGFISETRYGTFKLMEEEAQKASFKDMNMTEAEDEDLESAMASASDQREEELQVFWSYIVGMLTNLDSLPIERIHQMLKLFASHGGGVEFSQDELKHFLQRKVREHKLVFSGGVYQLAK